MSTPLANVFIGEATELLADLEKGLLQLERSPNDAEGISQVFRTMHTLKGSAKMFGFDSIDALTHQLETIYESIRTTNTGLTPEIFTITLAALDHLRNLLTGVAGDPGLQRVQANLLARIGAIIQQPTIVQNSAAISENADPLTAKSIYYISFAPDHKVLRNGTNTLYLIEDLLAKDNALVLPFFHRDVEMAWSDPLVNYTAFEVLLETFRSEHELRDIFLFVEDESELSIQIMPAEINTLTPQVYLLASQGHTLRAAQGYEALRDKLLPTIVGTDTQQITNRRDMGTSVRVPSERLDELMNLVSELVTTQAQLRLLVDSREEDQLTTISENMEKITRRLRDNAFGMSLIPIDSLVIRFSRMVRDLSRELNKDVIFHTEGTETEIDKSIIERLTDPILHLLRNALDHGLELPEDRARAGKSRQGKIALKAYHSGGSVVIEISDDGAGINLEKVKRKAIQKGILDADTQLSDKEITDLIFLPGFSTAGQITGVSGRGVGMDVVKRNIADLRGDIEIVTHAGRGTTFVISLPLTLSIIEGLLVTAANISFILPRSMVRKCYEVETSLLDCETHRQVVLDGDRIPVLNLCEEFTTGAPLPALSQVITVSHQGNTFGLAVEAIVGEYQAVLKPLGNCYRDQDEFSGATILGDGSVALIIDPTKLIRKLLAA